MNARMVLVSAALLGVGLLAGCDRAKEPASKPAIEVPSPKSSGMNQAPPQSPPTAAERKEGTTPIQGQVDPREPAQRKDFEEKKR